MTEENALDVQVGGNHYKKWAVQPVQIIVLDNLSFLHGCILKRLLRDKGDRKEDLQKVLHELNLIEQLHHSQEPEDRNAVYEAFFEQIADDQLRVVVMNLMNENFLMREYGAKNEGSMRLLETLRNDVSSMLTDLDG
jgi:hypothetical protein